MSAVCTSTAPPKLQLRSFGFYPSGLVPGEEQISLNDDAARQDRNSNKPLPYIPRDVSITLNGTGDSRPPVTKPHLRPTPVFPASPRKETSYLSFYSCTKSSAKMLETFQTSPILATLLAYLDWVDAYSLFATCKTFREVLRELQLRDVVLSRFVPGYAHAIKGRNMKKYHDVPVSMHDLDLLVISQRLPLHRYPTHALRTLTSLYPTFEDDETTRKLIALSQAHSRFVLLLQSLLHSSSLPIPPEPPADLEPPSKYARSRFSLSSHPSPRELTFPAPLAYAEETQPPPRPESTLIKVNTNRKSGPSSNSILRQARHHIKGTSKSNGRSPSATTTARSSLDEGEFGQLSTPKISHHGPRPSASTLSSMMSTANMNNDEDDGTSKHGRRMSIFSIKSSRTRSRISPPPPEEPRTLKEFHETWTRRKTVRQKYYSMDFAYNYDYERDRDGRGSLLKRPTRRFASLDQRAASSDSSISSLQGRDSPAGSRNYVSPGSVSNSNPTSSQNSISSTSHHDLIRAATSRLRAPILRVFVPCTHLDAGGKSVVQCEKQLERAGLWEHLSTGDVVCNFGYVPMSAEDEGKLDLGKNANVTKNGTVRPKYSPTSSDSNSSGPGHLSKSKQTSTNSTSTSEAGHRKWLVFNGRVLVPYTPPSLVPISKPLRLPSPFYYKHLVASDNFASRSSGLGVAFSPNFTFMISRMPAVSQEDILDMRLVKADTRVPSPHSPMGYAIVRRWAWIARISRTKKVNLHKDHPDELGEGWLGEWVLEYEGTKEGHEVLLGALGGKSLGKAVWELVKEKSGDGRIWLRLLP